MNSKLTAILAMARCGAIGDKGGFPWPRLKGDLPRFKQLTMGHPVIMGRKTWDSLGGKGLPGRKNIVMSHGFVPVGSALRPVICNAFLQALNAAYDQPNARAFVIGGAQIYTLFWDSIDRIELTEVDGVYPDADTRFDFDRSRWYETHRVVPATVEGQPRIAFVTLERR